MVVTLSAHADRWTGNAPASGPTTYEAGIRLGVAMPKELETLLEISDGLVVVRAGVTILGTDELEPVEGVVVDGLPAAIWFARDVRANRYAVSVVGWRGSDGGDVVRVPRRGSVRDAPFIGTLPEVIARWLEGSGPATTARRSPRRGRSAPACRR
jgi:hypothetical protein